jgi:RNA polymerase sigma-70 factor (ECF subfamily)
MTLATTLATPARLALFDGASDALDARVRAVVEVHHDALWRFLRRMGVPEAHVEDAVQHVLLVFARRAADVDEGAERSFLFGTAHRVASDVRRKALRDREVVDVEALLQHADPSPDAEGQLGDKELRRCLDRVLEALAPDLRAVFVLAELEEMTMVEVSQLLSIPPGTVASRLRRARELVLASALEMRAYVTKGANDDEPR